MFKRRLSGFGLLIFIFCSLGLSAVSHAKTSMWKVSKGDDYLFIGGTVHILSEKDYPLPPAFQNTYQLAQKLILETDIQKMKSLDFQMRLIDEISYKNGKSLKSELSEGTFQALEAALSKHGMPMIAVNKFKPGVVISMLSVLELQNLGIGAEGVDSFFDNKARKDNKGFGQLETLDEQVAFLNAMGMTNPDEFVRFSLRDIDKLSDLFTDIIKAWREGDMQTLAEIGIKPMREDFPETYQNLIVKRNQNWTPKIIEMLKTKEVEVILVGALHLAGPDSVLKALESQGYRVEQF